MMQLSFWDLIRDCEEGFKKLLEKAEHKKFKQIDLSNFNLIYFRKTDGRKFLVRYVTKLDLILIDTVTGEILRLGEMKVRTRFVPDKITNKRNKKRRPFINFGKRKFMKSREITR